MVKIKNYDNYTGDKIISTASIKNFTTSKIVFEDGSELYFKDLLNATEKYGICEIKKINIINELVEKLK